MAVDPAEAERVAEAAVGLGLHHVVITSVTRDDLPDGGAGHFAAVIQAVKLRLPQAKIEVLTPDFQGHLTALETVLAAHPDIFNHNVETCRRLTPQLRDGADYDRSLNLLRAAYLRAGTTLRIKSGFMLGVGETAADIRETLRDLREAGVSMLTIGQYLAPSRHHFPVHRYVSPDEFEQWRRVADEEFKFTVAACGPEVRSSYHAADIALTPG